MVKQKAQKVICPLCQQSIILGIELNFLGKREASIYFPHIHLHGDPLHALICYLNSELKIRNIGIIKSIEIARDSDTFKQLMMKWTNPY